MNANELADELNKCVKDGSTDLVCVEQAATMLRQQQAEIEALKATNSAIEQDRPYWAQGYSSDSIAAQCSTSAMSELHKLLGVDNQTDAVSKLRQQQAEIEALKSELDRAVELYTDKAIRFEELERKAQEK